MKFKCLTTRFKLYSMFVGHIDSTLYKQFIISYVFQFTRKKSLNFLLCTWLYHKLYCNLDLCFTSSDEGFKKYNDSLHLFHGFEGNNQTVVPRKGGGELWETVAHGWRPLPRDNWLTVPQKLWNRCYIT